MTRTRPVFVSMAIALLPIAGISAAAGMAAGDPAGRELPTPVLIERAVGRGDLDRITADRYLIAALHGDPVPAAYSSESPFRGTLPLLELQRRLDRLGPGAHRRSLRDLLHPVAGIGTDDCGGAGAPLPDTLETAHFYIEYNDAAIGGGLTIDDYETALETTWSKEVDGFGWAAPPVFTNPAPNGKYPVRIENLGPALYGFVANSGTHAGFVGNNPNTAWSEGDAYASCMVLNSNYDPFPGEPLAALQATSAHEFNHSIQFGWGVLSGVTPDLTFIEGGATWMEDEVFDESNDNYNFLWPQFDDDMGQYLDSPVDSPYEYWITFRGLTEPHGTGVPGGGEDIMQSFWELTSRNERDSLEALDSALQSRGTSLGLAYHSYAIAVKFNKPCGGGYQPPHCLEEGPAYVSVAGPTATHGTVAMNATFGGSLLDNYALNWIELPQSTDLQAILKNTSSGGRFRASLACDTGTGFVIAPFTDVVDAGETAFVRSWNAAACPAPVAVVANVTQTAANPSSSALRTYSLTVSPPPDPSKLSVSGRVTNNKVIAKGKLTPSGGGDKVEVVLFRRKGGWKEVQSRNVGLGSGGTFRTRFRTPDAKRCRLEAEFEGDLTRLPSSTAKTFRC
ncbi:MAG: hypothetical protein ACRDHM_03455 [Actinomycetota bacterium]